ncbi:hypothetical protein MHU86_21180 [Fragilaria crotonensis]|nr:hypothetical protein MHU86_21180 [Fragilaria crotonensis]
MVQAPSLKSASSNTHRRHHRVTFAKGCGDSEVGFQVQWIPSNAVDDNQRMHCSRKEKKTMRRMARELAKQVHAHDNPHDNRGSSIMGYESVSNSSDLSANSYSEYTPIMLRAFESSCCHSTSLTHKERKSLLHWIANAHARRGLEKLSVHGLAGQMAKYRRLAIRTVLDLHATAMANHGYLSPAIQETIASRYRHYSEPSVRFAALIGRADSEAAWEQEEHDRAQLHQRSTSPTCVINLVNIDFPAGFPVDSFLASSMVRT